MNQTLNIKTLQQKKHSYQQAKSAYDKEASQWNQRADDIGRLCAKLRTGQFVHINEKFTFYIRGTNIEIDQYDWEDNYHVASYKVPLFIFASDNYETLISEQGLHGVITYK